MKVSKNSWHYRLMEKIGICDPYDRTNLCSYIRGILFTVFIPIALVLAPIVLYFIYPLLNSKYEAQTILEAIKITFFFLWGLFGSMIDGFLLIIIGVEYYNKNIKPYLPKRARKKKICPIIEFIEE